MSRTHAAGILGFLVLQPTCAPAEEAGQAGATQVQCATPIEGSSPFSVTVSGTAALPGGGQPATFSAQLYFPQGRIPNAPVWLAHADTFNHDLSVWKGNLGPQAQGDGLQVGDHCGNGITGGALLGPVGGLAGQLSHNLSGPGSDGLKIVQGPVQLCPEGSGPSPRLSYLGGFLPTRRVAYSMATPVDPSTLTTLHVPWLPVEIAVYESEGQLVLRPGAGAFPPGDWPLELSSLRDVMGAAYAAPSTLQVLKPEKALADPLLDTVSSQEVALAAGSILPTPGRLTIDGTGVGLGAVVGVGGSATNSSLRIKHRFLQCHDASDQKRVAVVASDGAVVEVPWGCAEASEDQVVALPGQGPWYIVVDTMGPRRLPCNGYNQSFSSWELEEFGFDP